MRRNLIPKAQKHYEIKTLADSKLNSIKNLISKIVSMIRKYHNHKLQTYPWHHEEEPHNNHETPGRQTK